MSKKGKGSDTIGGAAGAAIGAGAGSHINAVKETATASSAHEMLYAVAIMGGAVLALTIIAGTSKNAGKVTALLLFALLVNQGLRHVNPFVDWAAAHPLTPTKGSRK